MTQPTISQHVRKLESGLGVALFRRTTRSVELTASGEALVPRARELFSKAEEAVLLAKLAAGGDNPGGEVINIGAIDPAAHQLLPMLLRRFRNRFPKTQLNVKIYDSSTLIKALERDECHVGIMRPPTNSNLLKYRPLMSQQFVAVIPSNSDLAKKKTLNLRDFINQRVFTLNRFELSSFEDVFDQVCHAGIELDATVEASNTAAALALASAGAGITFLPEWIESIADDSVVLRRVGDLTHQISIGVGWRSDSPIPGIFPFVECATLVTSSDRGSNIVGNSAYEFTHLRSSDHAVAHSDTQSISRDPN
jgi:DNA-binding transcriptional LysR family regulator